MRLRSAGSKATRPQGVKGAAESRSRRQGATGPFIYVRGKKPKWRGQPERIKGVQACRQKQADNNNPRLAITESPRSVALRSQHSHWGTVPKPRE